MSFPLYTTLSHDLPSKDLTILKKSKLLKKIKTMDSQAHELIYALIRAYFFEHDSDRRTSFDPAKHNKIEDLEIHGKFTPDVVSFVDESKRMCKCTVSMIDFRSNKQLNNNTRYRCGWDRNIIPMGYQAIGCPIKYVANKATKTYYSELSKDNYRISELVTEKRAKEIDTRDDNRFTIERNNYYETDGVFCSFNCCMAFIQDPEQRRNSLYHFSETLLLQMYQEIHGECLGEILPAPHWRILQENGGHLTIDQFRETFNRLEFRDYGVITCKSLGYLYEDRLRF